MASLALVLQLGLAPFGHAMALQALLAATPAHHGGNAEHAGHAGHALHGHGDPAPEPRSGHTECPACLAVGAGVAVDVARSVLRVPVTWRSFRAPLSVVAAVRVPGLAVTIPPVRGPPPLQA